MSGEHVKVVGPNVFNRRYANHPLGSKGAAIGLKCMLPDESKGS